jgi:signal transduction histidine kinase
MARFPFRDPSGRRLLGAVGVDITPQRRAESSLRKLTGRLMSLRDEEQRRIARDLHDSTAQTLAALTMNLNMLHNHKELPFSTNLRKLIVSSADLADAASKEVRNLAHLLHPPDLDVMGLSAAIKWHIARTLEHTGIDVQVNLQANVGRLPKEIETALFRVVQESLENVRRHSGSSVARVRLRRNMTHIVLEVEDEGHGVMPGTSKKGDNSAAGSGVGVPGMHERLNHLGGMLEIETGKGGTKVTASVPIPAAQNPPLSR